MLVGRYTGEYAERDRGRTPYPVVRKLRVRSFDKRWQRTFDEALVDTGSSHSYVPRSVYDELQDVKRMGITWGTREVFGMDGVSLGYHPSFMLWLEIPSFQPKSFDVVGYADLVVIGRNILNEYRVVLEGVTGPTLGRQPRITVEYPRLATERPR